MTDRTQDRPAIPAATVVLLRDTSDGLETLLLRRSARGAFGGMWVFPGGKVEYADWEASGHTGQARDGAAADPAEAEAARHAAVRETREEAGLVVAPSDLVPLSHWVPPVQAPARFSTWFFLAPAPAGQDEVAVDGAEIHEHVWTAPTDALRRRDAGEIELAPPTWVTLWRLAETVGVEEALAQARASQPGRYHTRMASIAGQPAALWQGDVGYDGGDPDLPGPRNRLLMVDGGWRYEWSGPAPGA